MPRIHRTSIWQLQIPDGVDLLMVLTDDDGPSDISPAAVERLARESWPSDSSFATVSCGSLRGVTATRIERGTHWRGWWLPCRGRLVYATYQCATAQADAE